jgi:hypothetical protein
MELLCWVTTISVLTFASGLALVSFPIYARRYKWPVRNVFSSTTSLVSVLSGVTVVALPIAAFLMARWWTPIVVITLGYFLSDLIINIFRRFSPYVLVPLLLTGWYFSIPLFVRHWLDS